MAAPLASARLFLERQAAAFVRGLNERGYLVLVISNQPAIAQGRLDFRGLDRIHERLRGDLSDAGARIDGVFVCPHDEGAEAAGGPGVRHELAIACQCRRPAPGLLLQAASVHRVDLPRSFMICRNLKDVRAGKVALVETVLLTEVDAVQIEVPPELRPSHVVTDLVEALEVMDASREAALRP